MHKSKYLYRGDEILNICLNMIVRDEARNIERCLASVKDVVNCYVIDDTGSTDGTPELIKKNMDKYGIPGEVYHTPWQNFGYNREQSLRRVDSNIDYCLFIDADEELKCDDLSIFDNLTADAYTVHKDEDGVAYRTVSLIKPGLWHWHGVVHNYLLPINDDVTEEALWSIHFIHHNGGYKRRGMSWREFGLKEAAILEAELEKDSNNSRYQYYLARAYGNAGEQQKAYDAYKKRIAMGGWTEEVYESMVRASWCKWRMTGEFPVANFLSAYEYMPSRAEAIFYVAKYYRIHEAYHLAYMFGKVGAEIPYPRTAAIGIVKSIYDWAMLDELAAAACLSGHHAEAVELCDRLLSEGKLPKVEVKRVKDNRKIASKLRER